MQFTGALKYVAVVFFGIVPKRENDCPTIRPPL